MPGRGQGNGHAGGKGRDQQADPMDQQGGHGRSEQSPGHLKKAAGEQSARDFAPGHARRDDETTETTGLGDAVDALRRG